MASWRDDLKIGVDEIDGQHKQLCDAIDDLLDACRQGKGRTEILKTMKFLKEYTVKHFADEEVIQQKSGYPKCSEHKAIHDGFIEQVKKIEDDISKNGANIASVATLNMLLLDWLIKHITKVDQEISAYVNE